MSATDTGSGDFESSDTWLLVSLLLATTGKPFASLAEVIEAADRANQAIVRRAELETGLSRLIPAGYTTVCEAGYAPTPMVKEFWAMTTERNKSLRKAWKRLGDYIGSEERRVGQPPNADREHYVTEQAYAAAVDKYS